MNPLIDVLTKGGPIVVVVVAFLLWDIRKGITAGRERAERDGRLISALDRNSETLDRLERSLNSRPCLLQNSMRQVAQNLGEAAGRVVRKQGEQPRG